MSDSIKDLLDIIYDKNMKEINMLDDNLKHIYDIKAPIQTKIDFIKQNIELGLNLINQMKLCIQQKTEDYKKLNDYSDSILYSEKIIKLKQLYDNINKISSDIETIILDIDKYKVELKKYEIELNKLNIMCVDINYIIKDKMNINDVIIYYLNLFNDKRYCFKCIISSLFYKSYMKKNNICTSRNPDIIHTIFQPYELYKYHSEILRSLIKLNTYKTHVCKIKHLHKNKFEFDSCRYAHNSKELKRKCKLI